MLGQPISAYISNPSDGPDAPGGGPLPRRLYREYGGAVLRNRCLLILAVLAVLFAGLVSNQGRALASETSYDSEELRFLEIINGYREENGLSPLILSDALAVASERHSEDMGKYGFFSHYTAKSSYFPAGVSPLERMADSGYDYPNSARSENIAVGYETAEESFEAWRESPGHNAAMLGGEMRVIGIARIQAPGSEYGWYWTTGFGSEVDPTAHAAGEAPLSVRPEKAEEPDARGRVEDPAKAPAKVEKRDRDGVENGAMRDGSVWEQESRKEGKDLLSGGVARLGGYDSARDELSQGVRVTKGQEMVFRARMTNPQRFGPDDRLIVTVRDESGKLLASGEGLTSADAGRTGKAEWVWMTTDLSSFAGRRVSVGFLARTGAEDPATFLVDGVALKK